MSFLLSSHHVVASSSSSSRSRFCFSSPSSPSLLPPSLAFPVNRRKSYRLRLACAKDSDTVASGGDSKPSNGNLPKSRRDILLEYVRNVQPEFMELFMKRAPQQVVDAMRQTVTNMIGTLPPQFFAVTVTTVAENLAQLMYSVLMTGYMFRNAQYRLELQQSVEQISLPDPEEKNKDSDHAPGTQKKVTGEVIRWNNVTGPEKIDAVKYIEYLEAEIEELNRQVAKKSSNGHNELMEYLRNLEPQNIKELTSSAGEDVVFAMNTFIKRLLAVSDPAQMKTSVTETSAPQLANLLYWLMVVGYSIRNIEVRFDMERVLGTSPKLAELPPGEDI
ncbi:uncharacterized protein LOC122038374 [Zingiber officinale]|uniref:uncharacterized protein LOC121984694 n=1 Tax=Zingiber officinale TaxID=94328 RepID=UPI001C4D69EA|nr:uncharacterized protein LOC121984694 [Zingiber officinale]XP_042454029.1 uncharacterized protein LOC122038374 [Zingiber officinale]